MIRVKHVMFSLIVNELKRLQIENDELLGKHNAKADEIQSEVINLPEKTDDMHLLLLTYRDQVSLMRHLFLNLNFWVIFSTTGYLIAKCEK